MKTLFLVTMNAAVVLFLLLMSSCSISGYSKIRVFDSAGLSAKDRKAVITHVRSQEEEIFAEWLRNDAEIREKRWAKKDLSISIEGDNHRIKINGLYTIGDLNRGGPRFKAVKTKDGWTFSPWPPNPC